jgi:hypothetical protein
MASLPLTRHAFHGDWNYALHPQACPAIPAPRAPQEPVPEWNHALLSDPALTGMSLQQLSDLTDTLAVDGDVKRGRPPRLTFPDQVLAAVLHLRIALAAEPLAVLFDSSRTAMHRTPPAEDQETTQGAQHRHPAGGHSALRSHSPPGPSSSPERPPQQRDQDAMLMICKPLCGNKLGARSENANGRAAVLRNYSN